MDPAPPLHPCRLAMLGRGLQSPFLLCLLATPWAVPTGGTRGSQKGWGRRPGPDSCVLSSTWLQLPAFPKLFDIPSIRLIGSPWCTVRLCPSLNRGVSFKLLASNSPALLCSSGPRGGTCLGVALSLGSLPSWLLQFPDTCLTCSFDKSSTLKITSGTMAISTKENIPLSCNTALPRPECRPREPSTMSTRTHV